MSPCHIFMSVQAWSIKFSWRTKDGFYPWSIMNSSLILTHSSKRSTISTIRPMFISWWNRLSPSLTWVRQINDTSSTAKSGTCALQCLIYPGPIKFQSWPTMCGQPLRQPIFRKKMEDTIWVWINVGTVLNFCSKPFGNSEDLHFLILAGDFLFYLLLFLFLYTCIWSIQKPSHLGKITIVVIWSIMVLKLR